MKDPQTPESVTDRMVSLLFGDTRILKFDRVLYPVCESPALIDAVYRYCDEESLDPPKGVALTTNSSTAESLSETYHDRDLEVRTVDFLAEDPELSRRFDFVLSTPPVLNWENLDEERRREYAASLSSVSPTDTEVDSAGLYIERSLQFVRPEGRGVFLTDTAITTSEGASNTREYLSPLVNDITEVPPKSGSDFHEDRMITIVTGEGQGEYEPDEQVNWPDPNTIEERLVAAAHKTTEHRTTESIMTPLNELDIVPADREASSVYFHLFYEDYDTTLVYDDPETHTELHGHVSRAELKIEGNEPISTHTMPVTDDRCLNADAEIDTLLPTLGRYRYCFVGDPDEVLGLITRYDLNKLPIYHQLYDQLARFEIGLRGFIREHAPNWEEESTVTLGVYGSRELVPDRLTTAQLSDIVQIVDDLGLRADLEVDFSAYKSSLYDIVTLRNAVAHYNPIVHVMSSRPTADDPERGAPQLVAEYQLLTRCLSELERPTESHDIVAE